MCVWGDGWPWSLPRHPLCLPPQTPPHSRDGMRDCPPGLKRAALRPRAPCAPCVQKRSTSSVHCMRWGPQDERGGRRHRMRGCVCARAGRVAWDCIWQAVGVLVAHMVCVWMGGCVGVWVGTHSWPDPARAFERWYPAIGAAPPSRALRTERLSPAHRAPRVERHGPARPVGPRAKRASAPRSLVGG